MLRGLAAATVPIVPPHPDSVGHSDEVEPPTPLNDLRVVLGLFVELGLRLCFVLSLVLLPLLPVSAHAHERISHFPPRSWPGGQTNLNQSYL